MASRQTAPPLSPETRSNNWELYTSGKNDSSWFKDIGHPLKFDKLARNISVDVAIVGGGIAGVTTAYLLSKLSYVGSPQSKEEEERNNEMLQWLVRKWDPKDAEKFLAEMDNKYPKK